MFGNPPPYIPLKNLLDDAGYTIMENPKEYVDKADI